jgi:hypothetical protein
MTDNADGWGMWRTSDPTEGAIGRIAIKGNPEVFYPVRIHEIDRTYYACTLDGATGTTDFRRADVLFQTFGAALPTSAGSSIWFWADEAEEPQPLILDRDGSWGSGEGIPSYDDVSSSKWTLIHDTGADK